MVRTASVVWRFFDKIEKGGRCVAVACKLCAREYKFYGNTTNLKTHLVAKHPIQWQLTQDGTLDETTLHFEEESNQSDSSPKKRKESLKESIEFFETADVDGEPINEDNDTTVTLVREMHDGEEWLEDQYDHIETYQQPKRKKGKLRIKRELQSPTHRVSYISPTPLRFEKPDHYVIEESQKKDEFAIFGEYIGNKLRKFKSPHTRGNLQQLITTLLWQAEYGLYDNPESVKRILMYSGQETQQQSSANLEHDTHIHCEEVIVQD